MNDCPFCPDGHRRPGSKPMAVTIGPERDADGQPTTLHVSYTAGHHVSEAEVEWLRDIQWHLQECEQRYRQLQELSGQAIVRANVARGNREVDATRHATRVGDLERAIARYFAIDDEAGLRKALGERFDSLVRAAMDDDRPASG